MAYGGGAAARGGCAVFSMAGLLVGVGLVVWLGSIAADHSTPVRTRPTAEGAAGAEAAAEAGGLTVEVAPAAALKDGARVLVTSDDFRAGETVSVAMCAPGAELVVGQDVCDATSTVEVGVDGRGHLSVEYRVRRVVTAGGVPFDCTEDATRCELRVAAVEDPGRQGSVRLGYAPDPILATTTPG